MSSLVIKYFSTKKKKSYYYVLSIEMRSGTANAISNAILTQLQNDNLNIEKMFVLGVDGASVNVGVNHSVTTGLHNINPTIIVIKCICHSLHLAVEKTL